MLDELSTIRARFGLRFRCANCRQVMCRELVSPDIEDAPADPEELLESNLLKRQFYPCESCDNPVSILIGIKQLAFDEVFESKVPESATQSPAGQPLGARKALSAAPGRRFGERIGRPAY